MTTVDAIRAVTKDMQKQARKYLLWDRCYIRRNRPTKDNAGGQTDDWRRIKKDVPCLLATPETVRELGLADRIAATGERVILLPGIEWGKSDHDWGKFAVQETDQIEFIPDPTRPTETTIYEISGLKDDLTGPLVIVALVRKTE